MPLEEYRRKRRFADTPEPKGVARPARGGLRFVIQEHHATRFHHDFRLEAAGVLLSWAVPKGISMDPDDKRLAVAVEDHPLDYIDFEGTIPEGNYGAGAVMIWDEGTYESLEGDPDEGFKKGKLTVVLHGQKVRGEFHMVRTRMGGRGKSDDGNNWLLFKKRDAEAEPGWSLPKPARSVKSGRTIEEIRRAEPARWDSSASPTKAPKLPRAARRFGLEKPGADPLPRAVQPMLAKLIEEPFDDPGWFFEPKWDGVRAIAIVRRRGAESGVTLQSRTQNEMNRQYPEVVETLYAADLPGAVLDGEIVAVDGEGRPSFQRLQQRINLRGSADVQTIRAQIPVAYYVFDILHYNGHDLTSRPLEERRKILEAVVKPGGRLLLSDAFPEEGRVFYRVAQDHQLEGIVGKRRDSAYEPGRRSGAWVKVKVRKTLYAAVGGFTQGRRGRSSHFGALLLGLYDGKKQLQYIGHAGGGFTDQNLREILETLRTHIRKTPPFATEPKTNEPPTWTEPRMVVQVEYGEWTDEGILRFPVFKGVVSDVPPEACRLEEVRPPQISEEQPMDGAGRPRSTGAPAGAPATPASARRPDRELTPLERRLARLKLPVEFSNLEKVYWPERGLTKRDLVEYYLNVHKAILPHLRDRPLTLRRFPDGIHGENFHQKDYPDAPSYVTVARVWTDTNKKANVAPVCNDLATLLWLAQLGDIEMHAWYSRTAPAKRGEGHDGLPHTDFGSSEESLRGSILNFPDQLVFDVDPYIFPKGERPREGPGEKDPAYNRVGFEAATEGALLLRKLLVHMDLEVFVKTSGKTGLHLYVPIARRYTYDETHTFAKTICQFLAGQHPEKFTTEWAVEKRVGKVFLDYNQNRLGATLASAYSLRPTEQATVSTPITWRELERGIDPLTFDYQAVPRRLEKSGDAWSDIHKTRQRLEEAIRVAGRR